MPKYRRGLLIGRFQPFHKGHRYLLLECAKLAEKLIILIQNSKLRKIMGNRGREKYLSQYSLEKHLQKMELILAQ